MTINFRKVFVGALLSSAICVSSPSLAAGLGGLGGAIGGVGSTLGAGGALGGGFGGTANSQAAFPDTPHIGAIGNRGPRLDNVGNKINSTAGKATSRGESLVGSTTGKASGAGDAANDGLPALGNVAMPSGAVAGQGSANGSGSADSDATGNVASRGLNIANVAGDNAEQIGSTASSKVNQVSAEGSGDAGASGQASANRSGASANASANGNANANLRAK